MSFLAKVRYKLGRWKARSAAYGSTLDNEGVRRAAVAQSSGPILGRAAGDAAVQDDHPDKRQHDTLGTDL